MEKLSNKKPGIATILCTMLCSWLIAYSITLVLIDQDAYSKAYLTVTVRSLLQNALKTPTSITFHNLRLGLGKAAVKNMHIATPNNEWSCHTDKLELRFSLWDMIKHRSLEVKAVLKQTNVVSAITASGIAIAPAIKQLFSANNTGNFISVVHVVIIDNDVTLIHESGKLQTRIAADLPLIGRYRTSYIWWNNGNAHYNNVQCIGNSHGLYRYNHDQKTTVIKHETTLLPSHLGNCIMQGTLSHDKGVWNFQSSELTPRSQEALQAKATINSNNECNATCTIPLAWLDSLTHKSANTSATGNIVLQCNGNISNMMSTGSIQAALDNGIWHNQPLPTVTATLTNLGDHPCARIHCPLWGTVQSQFSLNEHEYTAHMSTTQDNIITGSWHIKKASSVNVTVSKKGLYHGSYDLHFAQQNDKIHSCEGTFHGSLTDLSLTASSGIYNFTLGASFKDVPHLTHITLDEQDNPLITLHEQHGILKGIFDIRLLSLIGEHYTDSCTLGEGACNFAGTISTQTIDGTISLTSGSTIRIPYLYNILEALTMHFAIHLSKKSIAIDNVVLSLHQGTINISKAQGEFSNRGISWAIIPYVVQNCLISWCKDLFALISGAGTISYTAEKSLVQGFLVIEQGHISTNILSPQFSTNSSPSTSEKNINLDMHVVTRKPIQVKTPFLETQVGAMMHAQGATNHPLVKVHATLLEGTLLFPYKPLFIRKGTVTLHPSPVDSAVHSLNPALAYGNIGYDPHINLIAENTIKGYRIRMHVQGPVQSPDLTFSAQPHLPTEQIIALLFGGSEDGSIYVAMSTYIMQSIKDLLFGSPDSSSTTLQSLKNLFRPLGSVRFVPSFTDQSSRGGIRGSLAIEVNERLRGIIKQNFDLPQDVMLEVEYDLSDDARIRAIKDERGDLGAEIEASWKF